MKFYGSQVSLSTNKAYLLAGVLSVATSVTVTRQSGQAPTETFRPTKPKILAIQPFKEQACRPRPRGLPREAPVSRAQAPLRLCTNSLSQPGEEAAEVGGEQRAREPRAGRAPRQPPAGWTVGRFKSSDHPPNFSLLMDYSKPSLGFRVSTPYTGSGPKGSGSQSQLRGPWTQAPAPPGGPASTSRHPERARRPGGGTLVFHSIVSISPVTIPDGSDQDPTNSL